MTDMTFTPSHVGICVSNLARSLRFYCEGLGFELSETLEIGHEYAGALEVEGQVECTATFLRRDSMAIELLHYPSPGVFGQPSHRRNQLGLTHLAFYVDDLEAAASRGVDAGGTRLAATRFGADDPASVQVVFLADPDGTRVELMQAPPT